LSNESFSCVIIPLVSLFVNTTLYIPDSVKYSQRLCGRHELYGLLEEGLSSMREGKGRPASEVFDDIKRAFGFIIQTKTGDRVRPPILYLINNLNRA